MGYNRLKSLLDKYFEGLTSVKEEEEILHHLEQSGELPEELEKVKRYFNFLQSQKQEKSVLTYENFLGDYSNKTKQRQKRSRYYLIGIAASVLILVGIFFIRQPEKDKKVYAVINGQPVTNEKIAYKETKNALSKVSSELNKGNEELQIFLKFNQVRKILTKKEEP